MSYDPSRAARDPDRLAALRRAAVLDTSSEESFDRLTRLAARLLHAPTALVSLVDADRQSLTARETPLFHSFCRHVVARSEPLLIEDARAHPLGENNPAVSENGVIAYAGVPLVTADEYALGAFCVVDTRPHAWSDEDAGILQDLAALAMAEIERRAAALHSEAARHRLRTFLDAAPVGVLTCAPDGTPDYANREAERIGIAGWPPFGLLDANGDPLPPERAGLLRVLGGEEGAVQEDLIIERPDGSRVWVQASASRVCEENGALLGGQVVFVDITERVRASRRVAVQYAVSRVLAESADLGEAAPAILRAVGEGLDWEMGALWEVDNRENALRCRRLWHTPGVAEFAAACREMRFERGVGLPGRVWSGGEPAWIADVSGDDNFPRRDAANRADLHGAFAFPIRGQAGVLGVFEFLCRPCRPPDEDLLRMAALLGDQIGQFVERRSAEEALVAIHEKAHQVTESLERSLLLKLPENEFASLSLATIYEAAWDESMVGGDFFDAFSFGGGKIALVVGDATGKGLTAGIRTAEIKFVLRAFLRESPDPAHAFARLNDFVYDAQRVSCHDRENFIVLSLVVMDAATGEAAFTVAGAETPIVLRANGAGEMVEVGGLPLGIVSGQVYAGVTRFLAPGDAVLLATDGITEARRGPTEFLGVTGMLRLAAEAASGHSISARRIGEAVLHGARTFANGTLGDDVCILVAQRR